MAVGKVSLLDWLMFTWSFGWTGFFDPSSPPKISIALKQIKCVIGLTKKFLETLKNQNCYRLDRSYAKPSMKSNVFKLSIKQELHYTARGYVI